MHDLSRPTPLPARPRVVIVGMGGLGCPAAVTLAEASVDLVLVDDDRVELSNLQRQVLFATTDLGRPKVEVAAERLTARYPAIAVHTRAGRLTADNADALLAGADLVIDATDDPRARFIVNDWALAHAIPAVIGGVHRFQGMVLAHAGRGPCFRCLFEEDGPEVETCAVGGVIGAMAGLVGHLQAERAIALLGPGAAAVTGFVTTLDGLSGRERDVALPEGCEVCTRAPGGASPVPARQARERMSMAVQIKIPASLRKFVANQDSVAVEARDVREALDALEAQHPGIKSKLCDDSGNVRRFINLYANGEDIRFLDNLDTALGDGAELQIVPAIAGGWY